MTSDFSDFFLLDFWTGELLDFSSVMAVGAHVRNRRRAGVGGGNTDVICGLCGGGRGEEKLRCGCEMAMIGSTDQRKELSRDESIDRIDDGYWMKHEAVVLSRVSTLE